jgi:hypothetical protein
MMNLTMEKLISLLAIFSKTYPQLKDIEIEIIPYNNLFVAKCVADKIGEYIPVKKGRIHNIIPRKVILTTHAMEKQEQELLFIFTHECTHGITPYRERKVKETYVRIDHSRHFYIQFFKLLLIANESNYITRKFATIEELMTKDNRNENMTNDFKLYKS